MKAIYTIYEGGTYFDPLIKNRVIQIIQNKGDLGKRQNLTTRESEILTLLAQNFNKEIADKLCRGKRTVDNYRQTQLLKLDVKNSAALIKKAYDLGLIK